MSKDHRNLLVALDIGTSKVLALVAEIEDDGEFNVIGIGNAPSQGIKKGVVVNIEDTVQSIQKALEEAEVMAECRVENVFTGIAGNHVHSFNTKGMVAIRDKEVSAADVERVHENAKPINIQTDQQVLHMLIQEYLIDNQDGVRDPIGMSGQKLEVNAHIVTGAVSAVQNIIKCIRRCGLEINALVLQPLCSSLAVLTKDEKELGVVLVDIGGGTTDIAVYFQGVIQYTEIIPLGGDQITNDIAMALRTPTMDAEDLKISHGIAKQALANPAAMIDVPGIGEREYRPISKQSLAAVIEPRMEELFKFVVESLEHSGFSQMTPSGVVLTGGTVMMPGVIELAEEIFNKPARIGYPEYNGQFKEVLRNPKYATGIGLLREGRTQIVLGQQELEARPLRGAFQRAKEWFLGNF
ncbi:cell division protein FtsA [Polynucleobacter kasalickyi]|uniref:Cell division protein FtsA n=1 Tax=Polynucleobacter kasalickyi TaxID=1938817 RepID=A0A1W2AEB4_9BURK|nr:cell division protein FtsA [Polynucleobacter kasalickyi]SMC58801.1 cell division protein FtsA [Polynucleobacter kasalickyi]